MPQNLSRLQDIEWTGKSSFADLHNFGAKADIDNSVERRRVDFGGVVLHTTGNGAGLRRIWENKKNERDFDLRYSQRLADVLPYKCHFAIGITGIIIQLAPLQCYTNHSSGGYSGKYLNRSIWNKKGLFRFWAERFPELESPIDLPQWGLFGKNYSINKNSWGIDIIRNPSAKEQWNSAQVMACAALIANLHNHFSKPIDKFTVVTHSMISPFDRCDKKGDPWDLSIDFPIDTIIKTAQQMAQNLEENNNAGV